MQQQYSEVVMEHINISSSITATAADCSPESLEQQLQLIDESQLVLSPHAAAEAAMRSISISRSRPQPECRSVAGHQQFVGRVDDNTTTRSLSLLCC